jgi:peptidoglycan/xylan/chitin deacetylase (PgdA/CDA1 family)
MKKLSTAHELLLRAAAGVLSPVGSRGNLLILKYHRVLATPDDILSDEPDAAAFAAQMDLLQSLFQVLPLAEAAQRLKARSLPARAACITFDDGYANNLEVAAPILAARKLPATVFVASAYLQGGCMWNDTVIEAVRHAPARLDLSDLGAGMHELSDGASRLRAIEHILTSLKHLGQAEREAKAGAIAQRVGSTSVRVMLSAAQVRELGGYGVDVGAHTMTHPILTRVDAETASREILAGKAQLEDITGSRVLTFAYPNGRPTHDYDRSHVDIVRKAGFVAAVSTAWACARASSDVYQLPRVSPWDRTPLRYALRLVRTYVQSPAKVA